MSIYLGADELASGDPIKIAGEQVDKIMLGDEAVWVNNYPPTKIIDFTASKLEIDQITLSFTLATGIPNDITYNLVNADTDQVLVGDIFPGYVWNTEEASLLLRIDAINVIGTTPSNTDTGTTREPAGSQEYNTKGSHTFIAPRGYTSVGICMIGGGGSGYSNVWGIQNQNLGGGNTGNIITESVDVDLGEEIEVIVGAGANTVTVGSQAGSASTFKGLSASGGVGGTTGTYYGSNSPRTTCGGTFNDGRTDLYSPHNSRAYGGRAGFGRGGFLNAANYSNRNGIRGSGGCGGWSSPIRAGNGGDGVVIISWV